MSSYDERRKMEDPHRFPADICEELKRVLGRDPSSYRPSEFRLLDDDWIFRSCEFGDVDGTHLIVYLGRSADVSADLPIDIFVHDVPKEPPVNGDSSLKGMTYHVVEMLTVFSYQIDPESVHEARIRVPLDAF
jgi:hypothetical protein